MGVSFRHRDRHKGCNSGTSKLSSLDIYVSSALVPPSRCQGACSTRCICGRDNHIFEGLPLVECTLQLIPLICFEAGLWHRHTVYIQSTLAHSSCCKLYVCHLYREMIELVAIDRLRVNGFAFESAQTVQALQRRSGPS